MSEFRLSTLSCRNEEDFVSQRGRGDMSLALVHSPAVLYKVQASADQCQYGRKQDHEEGSSSGDAALQDYLENLEATASQSSDASEASFQSVLVDMTLMLALITRNGDTTMVGRSGS